MGHALIVDAEGIQKVERCRFLRGQFTLGAGIVIDRGDFHVALFLFFQQFFTGLEYIARADGQNKVARAGDARERGSHLVERRAVNGSGDLAAQVHRRNADVILLARGVDLCQHDDVGYAQLLDKIVKQRLRARVGVRLENAPELVKACIGSVRKYMSDYNIRIITFENMENYIRFPQYILEKWHNRIISNTLMSDLIRTELLVQYGGLWLDATVLLTAPVPEYVFEKKLFMYTHSYPDDVTMVFNNWLIYSDGNSRLLRVTRDLLYEYWKQ